MRILVACTLTPATSAAASLPPMAYMYLPWRVLLYRNQKQAATTRAIQIRTGTPTMVLEAREVKFLFKEPMGVPPVYTRQIP